jgi:hypothetical protein
MSKPRKLREEIEKDLIDYFDSIRLQVDVRAQILFYELETGKVESSFKFNKRIITDVRKRMIEKINEKLNESINDLNDFFSKKLESNMSKDQIKLKALRNDCVYFRNEELIKNQKISSHRLRYDRLDKYKMGFLLCFDWYLDENLMNFIE